MTSEEIIKSLLEAINKLNETNKHLPTSLEKIHDELVEIDENLWELVETLDDEDDEDDEDYDEEEEDFEDPDDEKDKKDK